MGTKVLDANWGQLDAWVKLAWFAVGLSGAGSAAISIRNGLDAVREKRKNDINACLLAGIAKIIAQTKINLTDVGLSFYRVKGVGRWQKQVRELRVRFSNYPPSSVIAWTKGKGVVGRCWDAKHHEVFFVRNGAKHVGCSATDWDAASTEDKMGLTFLEWQVTQRYALIMAVPVNVGGKRYEGCITLDTTREESAKALLCHDVWNYLADAAGAVEKALGNS